jgi:hypothetical protein
MVGQGSPNALRIRSAIVDRLLPGGIFVLAPLVAFCCALTAHAQQAELRFRVAWGGGQSQLWQGRISISEGAIAGVSPLGLEMDEPGSIYLDTADINPRTIVIAPKSLRAYDAVDFTVAAPTTATLTVDIAPAGKQGPATEIPLADLISNTHKGQLDQTGNQLLVRRAPGDLLRINFDRSHLVFGPGEKFGFRVAPHRLGLPAGMKVRLKVALTYARGGAEHFSEVRQLTVDAEGNLPEGNPFAVTLPRVETAYDLVVSVTEDRMRLIPAIGGVKPNVLRRLQLVVVDDEPRRQAVVAQQPRQVTEIDPTSQNWWGRLPGWGNSSLSNGKSSKVTRAAGDMLELAVGGWQAYPLSVDGVGLPHVLEVEYDVDAAQTLGISVVGPDSFGNATPRGVDSGVEVPKPIPGASQAEGVHRFVFWPQTKTPWVVIANRSQENSATFGKIRVLAGLPQPAIHTPADLQQDLRLLTAYYAKPLFPEQFSAPEAPAPVNRRTLDDWLTFHQGAQRLLSHLKTTGMNSATISVVCEGGALYPSQVLQATPRYDTGIFFADGKDPIRKDVLEMLLRMFDREGLTLIPAVQFIAPLPDLENELRLGGPQAAGLKWVDGKGRTLRGGDAPCYNPLDPAVRREMAEVIAELVDRYGRHPSFGGIAVQLVPSGYAQLPGANWGFDDQTIGRFESNSGLRTPSGGDERFARREQLLLNTEAKKWLQWRAMQVTDGYRRMADEIVRVRPGKKLYLLTDGLLDSETLRRVMKPALPRQAALADALLELGIDIAALQADTRIVLTRPFVEPQFKTLPQQNVELEVNTSDAADRLFRRASVPASVCYQSTSAQPLPSFDEVRPFASGQTPSLFVPRIAPAGWGNRARFVHSLAALDTWVMIDGGDQLTLGEQESLRSVFEIYRRLPAARFETIEGDRIHAKPVVIRRYAAEDRTYIYLANDSPWQVSIDLDVSAPFDCRVVPLGAGKGLPPINGQPTTWRLQLEPYDLAGAVLMAPNVMIDRASVQLPQQVARDLEKRINSVGKRAQAIKDTPALRVLRNPDFELPSGLVIAGWKHNMREGQTEVVVDAAHGKSGAASLSVSSAGPVAWVRSNPFAPPTSGRLHVFAWLKTDKPQRQPAFRIALDDGRNYYKFAPVGQDGPPLTDEWQLFVFQVDQLPVSHIEQLSVGFDLMGPGTVWVDQVQLFDIALNQGELNQLTKIIALADFHLRKNNLADCRRVLEGYWPRFLLEHNPIPPPRMAVRPVPPVAPPPAEPPEEKSMFDKVKDRLTPPKLPDLF